MASKHDMFNRNVLLMILFMVADLIIVVSCQTVSPMCPNMCGDVRIPYPFGLSEACCLNSAFNITCNSTHFDPPRPFLQGSTEKEVTSISLDGELWINMPFGTYCRDENATVNDTVLNVTLSSFSLSATRNRFTAIGCDTVGLIFRGDESSDDDNVSASGCLSLCKSDKSVTEGSCDGIGCCQTVIPKRVSSYSIVVTDLNATDTGSFSRCSYVFVVEQASFCFSRADLKDMQNRTSLPLVVDWAVWNEKCDDARRNMTSYACKAANSICYDPDNINGYRCNCSRGYHGNPYIPDGCTDIDECSDPESNPCSRKCHNIPGGYRCSCPVGFRGDGKKDGEGCRVNQSFMVSIIVGAGVVFFGIGFLYIGMKKRNLILLKEKYFRQNGGLLLQQQLRGRDGSTGGTTKIFKAEELEKATENYHDSRIVGRGGYGTVYKGILADKKVVAIKKSRQVDQTQIEQFVNEVIVLSQINHRNVVKLLGCCLETEVPLLVYKFVGNGTLFDHIHNSNVDTKMSWETRLRIAIETARALSYLHSATSVPIIHRDIKSTNILLDENYVAKVSDFGASRLIPVDQKELSTMVQGTMGYLDPEYLQTSMLTEKSDVYSFGVVLTELMTGQKAVSFDKPEEERCLALQFLSSLKDNCLFQIIDDSIASNDRDTQQIREVAVLANRCLRIRGEDRPTMKEVEMELEGITVAGNHPWRAIKLNSDEMESLLGENINSSLCSEAGVGYDYDSKMVHVKSTVGGGR